VNKIKTLIISICALVLLSGIVLAVPNDGPGPNNNIPPSGGHNEPSGDNDLNNTQWNDTQKNRTIHGNITEWKEMNFSLKNISEPNDRPHGNVVNDFVHMMLHMENFTGGIGKNVSQIAMEFNNSIEKRIHAEDRLQNRSNFTKLFIGSDKKAIRDIEDEINKTDKRIDKLYQLLNTCNCTDEIKTMLQEQIQIMEHEQERLQNMTQTEKKVNGMFGWLFK
jgi:hypothetical protein